MTTNPTAPQDGGEKLAEAERWMCSLPRYQFDMLLLLGNKAHARGRNEALEEAAKVAFAYQQNIREPHDWFIATDIAGLIRALQQKGPSNG